jgi:hypothetical protein
MTAATAAATGRTVGSWCSSEALAYSKEDDEDGGTTDDENAG